ncbi:SAM-dependent methyltransferase [Aerosakkonema funiforme]|uniref:SAM-dependent methyltransferase n=1 Tax=Aerosakkonema funiforme TaxID=1246630 RepID=UPI0035B8FB56
MNSGSLTIVGTGIRLISQITPEARAYIEQAEKLLFVVADLPTIAWLKKINSTSESLSVFYQPGKNRLTTYLEMVERILSCVREGLKVCVVFYGHPGVFVYPSHEAIKRARLEGFCARMLPAISAEDCLFADLGIDPATSGCQSFEATDFLVYKRKFDTSSSLILWQFGIVGELSFNPEIRASRCLPILIEYLQQYYDPDHEIIIYEAAQYPVCTPVIQHVPLAKVPEILDNSMSTLYIPPKAPASPDLEMLDRLGIPYSIQE